jgi:hypothetical protein
MMFYVVGTTQYSSRKISASSIEEAKARWRLKMLVQEHNSVADMPIDMIYTKEII